MGVGEQVGALGQVPRLGVLDHRVRQCGEGVWCGPERPEGRDRVVAGNTQDPDPHHGGDEHRRRPGGGRRRRRRPPTETETRVENDSYTTSRTYAARCSPRGLVEQRRRAVTEEQPAVPREQQLVAGLVEHVPALQVVIAEVHDVVGEEHAGSRGQSTPGPPLAHRPEDAPERPSARRTPDAVDDDEDGEDACRQGHAAQQDGAVRIPQPDADLRRAHDRDRREGRDHGPQPKHSSAGAGLAPTVGGARYFSGPPEARAPPSSQA